MLPSRSANRRCWHRLRPRPPPQQRSPLRVMRNRPSVPIRQKTLTPPCVVLCVRPRRPPAPPQQSASKPLGVPRQPLLPRRPHAVKNARSRRRTSPPKGKLLAMQTLRCAAKQRAPFSRRPQSSRAGFQIRIRSPLLRRSLSTLSHCCGPRQDRQRWTRRPHPMNRSQPAAPTVTNTVLIRPPLSHQHVGPPEVTRVRLAARKATIPTMHPEFARYTAAPISLLHKPSTLQLVRYDIQFQRRVAPLLRPRRPRE